MSRSDSRFDSTPSSPVNTPCLYHRPTVAVVHLSHIQSNLKAVQNRVGPGRKVWAVVKANAYGHGMIPVAEACLEAGAHGLAIATTDEAVTLRERFPDPPILLLGPCFPQDVKFLIAHRIEIAVGDREVALAMEKEAARIGLPAMAHLKIDTGMGRFGFSAEGIGPIAEEITGLKGIQWRGLFTHLAVSDSPTREDRDYTAMQIHWFHRAVRDFLHEVPTSPGVPPMLHACNSGGILQHPDAFLDAVRPGVMLYGHLPDPTTEPTVPLLPGMTLKTRIVGIRSHPAGAQLSYGRTYTCPEPRRIAILPVGYGDGYNRQLSNRGEVVVCGRRAPIRGRVCMDQTLIDVTEISEAGIGSEVILFGGPPDDNGRPPLPVMEVAGWLKTITYEVTCQVGRRVPRIYEP